jgi:putative hydrolase of the HAD superfamily
MPVSAVIFDYGMVLSNAADPDAHKQLVEIFGASREDFEREYWAHRHAYDEGQFDGTGYWKRCAAGAGASLSAEQTRQLISTDIRMWSDLNRTMVDWAVTIGNSGFKTGILSNIGFELADEFKQHDWVRGFTHNTWSCELRLAKPDPAIYHHVIESLGILPETGLFLDDRIENVVSAESVGLQAILFRSVEQLRHDLQVRNLAEALPPLGSGGKVPAAVL